MSSTIGPFHQKKRIVALWLFSVAVLAVLIISRPNLNEESVMDVVLDISGAFLILAGVLGRLWSTLYIGGKKNEQLVTTGPYAMTRNPLYFFSLMAMFGASLMFGSALVAGAVLLGGLVIFSFTARREARYLAYRYGMEYAAYACVTPLFWPRLSSLCSPAEITISVKALKRTLREALVFLLLIPLMEVLEYLHFENYLAAFFHIP
ncbi:isoprenylcysteine carboxylmethyltransferase family protein [Cupriavidus sp. AU9028]|uniref:methyltransferase family protein n=1 Tax=Cupriavidus sp. AU9028 TaxID=2871157 RepID=UPI00210640F3|nr:isoprenylcysteine carboxylmethyltransferase family protein [Cupriavidus sp. AU9028]